MTGAGTRTNPRAAKYMLDSAVIRGGNLRYSRTSYALTFLEAEQAYLDMVAADPDCILLPGLDIQVLDTRVLVKYLHERKLPFDMKDGMTVRQIVAELSEQFLFSQRCEGVLGTPLDLILSTRDKTLDSEVSQLPLAARDELVTVLESFGVGVREVALAQPTVRHILRTVRPLASRKTLFIGGLEINRDFSYGQNRSVVATDTFDTTIGASWTNGPGNFVTWAADGAGIVEPSSTESFCGLAYTGSSFANDQYSKITLASSTAFTYVGPYVRNTAASSACYIGQIGEGEDDRYITELSSVLGETTLATDTSGTGFPSAANDTVTFEAEGTTLRLGDDLDGSDGQTLETTDATLTSGAAGFYCYLSTAGSGVCEVTAWEGGDIAAAGGGVVIPVIYTQSRFRRI